MKNILVVGLDWFLGGIETYLYNLVVNLHHKYTFDFLITYDKEPCYYRELIDLGCSFIHVTSRRQNPIKNFVETRNAIGEKHYDLLYANLNSLNNINHCLAAIQKQVPVVIHCHNSSSLRSLHSRIMHKINQYIIPWKKIECIAVSKIAGEWMFGNRKRFHIVNNGVDIEKYRYSKEKRSLLRSQFGIKDEILFVHIGAFREQKNHRFLVEVFKEFHNIVNSSKLMLVGTGELLNEIKGIVQAYGLCEDVLFLGVRENIPDILSAGDVFLFPSKYEGFPIALIEAETSGIMCFASNNITEEVVVPGLCHQISLEDSAQLWANTIRSTLLMNGACRENCCKSIDELGLGINKEVMDIEKIFENIWDNSKKG